MAATCHVRAVLSAWLLACTVACQPKIPSDVFACVDASDCPTNFSCVAKAGLETKVCSSSQDSDTDYSGGGASAGPPSSGTFTTAGVHRTDGSITVTDDGFTQGATTCSADGKLCVTGSLQP
ncbi:MAG: hypothetical protein ABW252_21135 [Polyangiales bacterium]